MNIVNSDAFQKSQLPPEKELPAIKTASVQP
jgi:hypothetical protein